MCCQESGEREASVSLFCPKAKQGEKKFRKVCTTNHLFFLLFITNSNKIVGINTSLFLMVGNYKSST